jgi:histidine triad (HIT) family protein
VKHSDIVYRDTDLTAFISPHWWSNNPGHVVIIPNEHHENLYVTPDALLGAAAVLSKRVALTLIEAYGCAGTSVRQHNEPAGGQDMWHYHLHVFPRYVGDDLHGGVPELITPEQRSPYAERVRMALDAAT